jgi:hypothetical protein
VDKWLEAGNVQKTRRNEDSASVSVVLGPACYKSNSYDQTHCNVRK